MEPSNKNPSLPGKDEFAQRIVEGIRQAGETADVLYDDGQFRLHTDGDDGTQVFLENGYREFCEASADAREQIVRRFVRNWFAGARELPEEFEDVRPDLLPVVRSRAYIELNALRMRAQGQSSVEWTYQPVGDHLAAALVYDLPDAMQAVTQEQLDRWGVSFYEAMETARANLAEMQHAFIGPEEGEGVYLSATGDNYDASRLLLLDTVGRMRLKGRPVAIAANRDSLIVAGDDDLEALRGMVALAGEALQKPRAVSGVALRLDGDEWGPWLPEASHPLYGEFRSLFIQSIGQAYAEQKTLLDQLHARTGEDVVVPSFSAMRNPATGGVLTFCIWGEHCTSLLPCTDLVAFVGVGRDPVMAPWGRVVETLGHLMRPEGIYPERYRVVDFPTREQLAAMENVMP